jgi:3-oxoacyl-[acyl-carrier-protein] synthase-3
MSGAGASLRRVRIRGTGMYVPPRVVTNQELEALMDTSDEWIQQRTGIRERRWAEEGVGTSDLAFQASLRALAAAGLDAGDLDLVIVATLSPDYYCPGSSALLQDLLGLSTTPAFDVRCQCSGFLYALNMGQLFVASGQYDRVLVCGAEKLSACLDISAQGRGVSVLSGDGAGAVVLEPSDDPGRGILSMRLHAEGRHARRLWMEAPTTRQQLFLTPEMVAEGRMYTHMEGKFVFKHAVTRMPEVVRETLDAEGKAIENVDLFLFHQANLRINEQVARNLAIPESRLYNNIDRYGNCSSASIPICLDECVRSGRVRPGDLICMTAFGSGFTWASALMRW